MKNTFENNPNKAPGQEETSEITSSEPEENTDSFEQKEKLSHGQIENLTPHTVNLVDDNGQVIATFEPTGTIARSKQTDIAVEKLKIDHKTTVSIVKTTYGEPVELPEYDENKYYIVSVLTAQAAKDHGRETKDLLISSDPVRDDSGRIIGCRRFAIL